MDEILNLIESVSEGFPSHFYFNVMSFIFVLYCGFTSTVNS